MNNNTYMCVYNCVYFTIGELLATGSEDTSIKVYACVDSIQICTSPNTTNLNYWLMLFSKHACVIPLGIVCCVLI